VPHMIDLAFVALFSVGLLAFEHWYAWPRIRAAIASGAPGARLATYRRVLLVQWPLVLLVAARWVQVGRPWGALGILPPEGWRLAAALPLVVAGGAFFYRQARRVARVRAEHLAPLRAQLERVAPILPHTPRERAWFRAVSVTAGVCEETLYRGFAVWALAPWLTLPGAALASLALFGLAHAYLGRQAALRATAIGAVLGALALLTGSVLPSILLHAFVDLGAGEVGYAVLRDRTPER
jgi:uncharacterized protein